MIRRRMGESFFLIEQIEHARIAGEIAQRIDWTFGPLPVEVLDAIVHHEDGWAMHDDLPTLNENNQPLDVSEASISLWVQMGSASVERASSLGKYSMLLVSLHQLQLAIHARPKNAKEIFELNKFQHRQVEIQESLRRELGMRDDLPLELGLAAKGLDAREDHLREHLGALSFCDGVSLQLCNREKTPATRIDGEFHIAGRKVALALGTEEAFRREYEAAAIEQITVRLQST